MSLILDGTTGVPVTTVTGTLPVANGGTGVTTSTGTGATVRGTSPSISGAVMSTMASSVLTSATAQNSTSGTSIDFTGIPSWVKRITVMLVGVSTNGTSNIQIQIGSGSVTTSGYLGSAVVTGTGVANNSTGFLTSSGGAAVDIRHGIAIINLITTNTYVMTYVGGYSNVAVIAHAGGSLGLGGTLDRVRITTVNGTDTFDAGSINIMYE